MYETKQRHRFKLESVTKGNWCDIGIIHKNKAIFNSQFNLMEWLENLYVEIGYRTKKNYRLVFAMIDII